MPTNWFNSPETIRTFRGWDESQHPRDEQGQFTESGREAHSSEVRGSPEYKLGLVIDTATKMAAKSPDPNAFSAIAAKLRGLPTDILEDLNREHTSGVAKKVEEFEDTRDIERFERAKEDRAVVAYLKTPKEKRKGPIPRITHRAAEHMWSWLFGKHESERTF